MFSITWRDEVYAKEKQAVVAPNLKTARLIFDLLKMDHNSFDIVLTDIMKGLVLEDSTQL